MAVLKQLSKIMTNFKAVFFIIFLIIISFVSIPATTFAQAAQTKISLAVSASNIVLPPIISLINPVTTDYLVLSVGPVRLDTGATLANIRIQITIQLNNSSTPIVIEGFTNTQGILVFNSGESLASQNLTVISGSSTDIQNLTNQNSIDQAFATVFYQSTQVRSTIVNYTYEPPAPNPSPNPNPSPGPNPSPNPSPGPSPNLNPTLTSPRTGGDTLILSLVGISIFLTALFIIYQKTRKRTLKS